MNQNKRKTKLTCVLLAMIIWLSCILPVSAGFTGNQVSAATTSSAANMLKTVKNPQVAVVGGEWAVIGLARSGYNVPQSYWDNYYKNVEKYVKECKGNLHDKKYTEYSRVIVALSSIGADPTDVAGYNLLTALGDFDKTIWQGINGPIWALIALDTKNYDMPVNKEAKTQATRQMYIDEILSRQLDNGGWNLTSKGGSSESDVDITGMALQALAKYQDQLKVKTATEKALAHLSKVQNDEGGFSNKGVKTLESTVQVAVGLTELGIDLNDSRFVKNGKTVVDNLLSYRQNDGSFIHSEGANGNNQMASEQGLYALVAVNRALEGKSSLYKMNDVTISVNQGKQESTENTGIDGKHKEVKKVPVVNKDVNFSDVKGNKNQKYIEELASRNIVVGSNNKYQPNNNLTRAEFAAIAVNALGLPTNNDSNFKDVKKSDWYYSFVSTAYKYGIVGGVSKDEFNPNGVITVQEAAVMTANAAKLCGLKSDMNESDIKNMLAQFGDYIKVSDWAKKYVAFCYEQNIFDQSELNIQPEKPVTRGEMAAMIYKTLEAGKLL